MSSILSLRSLPEGIVTFLFTDVEGSPLLATALGDAAWRELLETPRRLLRRAFATYGGVELGTQGDSFFVVFSRASDASKIAFVHFVRFIAARGFGLIDCQMHTPHLESLGAREMPRAAFARLLAELVDYEAPIGRWHATFGPSSCRS